MEEFRQQVAGSGKDYLVIAKDAGQRQVQIRFLGTLQGREVIWNARLLALCGESRVSAHPRQFIEVSPRDALDYDLTIGLAVPEIDRATILKAMIMIRKYKRLHVGYHEFGPEPV